MIVLFLVTLVIAGAVAGGIVDVGFWPEGPRLGGALWGALGAIARALIGAGAAGGWPGAVLGSVGSGLSAWTFLWGFGSSGPPLAL